MARASLEELLLDYEDFLCQRRLELWAKDSPRALAVRNSYKSDKSDLSDRSDPFNISSIGPEEAANTIICLIHQASFLLGRQISKLEQMFLSNGGFTERMYHKRRHSR